MPSLRRPPAEITSLRRRRDELFRQVADLERSHDLETRPDERLRLDAILSDRKKQLAEAEAAFEPCDLVEKADDLERKCSFPAAIATWNRIAILQPDAPEPSIEILRLLDRQANDERLGQLTAGLMKRRRELETIWPEIRASLEDLRSGAREESTLILFDELLNGTLDAQSFIRDWDTNRRSAGQLAPKSEAFRVLADRLQRGDIALFLGSDLAHQSNQQMPGTDVLVEVLARHANVEELGLGLAGVSEYYHLSLHGRPSLARILRQYLSTPAEIPLYSLLAQIASPLVVISTSWDLHLESTFRQAGKPFAGVYPLLSSRTGVSQLLVQRSDQLEVQTVAAEDLSGLRLLERYSVIFKARGSIMVDELGSEGEGALLTLTERDHFTFARQHQDFLPTYLMRLLADRGLLILGMSARHWEDRLLLDAVLDRRQGSDRPIMAGPAGNSFEQVFWQEHTKRLEISIPELVEYFVAHLRLER